MTSEHFEPEKAEEPKHVQSRKLEVDWTESEWFAVWLRLARGEYQPAKQPVVAASS